MITALLSLLLCARAAADEIELQSGRIIEGKVEDQGDAYKIILPNGSVTYPKYLVKRITPKKTADELYQDQALELKPGDVEGHLKLARWCLERKLAKEAVAEYKKVIAASPDHEEARKGAGYVRVNDVWMTEDQANEARGLVRHKGVWMTPEEKSLQLALEEQKELDAKLLQKVQSLLEITRLSDEKKRDEAITALAGIEDKYKVKPFLAAITTQYKHTRRYVFEELGRMREQAAARPLVRRSLWDEDEALRPLAFKALTQIANPDTALYFVPFLGEHSVSARMRCEESLAAFKDFRAVPALAEALENNVASLRAVEQYGEEMTTMTDRTLIMRDGSRVTLPKSVRIRPDFTDKRMKEKLEQEKSTILSTLRIITGVDLGEDPARWRAWHARKQPGKDP
jgi:hypothetical protein